MLDRSHSFFGSVSGFLKIKLLTTFGEQAPNKRGCYSHHHLSGSSPSKTKWHFDEQMGGSLQYDHACGLLEDLLARGLIAFQVFRGSDFFSVPYFVPL